MTAAAKQLDLALYPYQQRAVDWVNDRAKSILALDMRLGKSPVTLCAEKPFPVLIICPAAVKLNWIREIEKWDPGRTHRVLTGRKDRVVQGEADYYILNYDLLQYILVEESQMWLRKVPTVILDEAHFAKNPEAKRTILAMNVVRNAEKVIALSGTIMPNRPIELYPLLKGMGALELMTKRQYGKRYCGLWNSPWGWDYSGATNLDELHDVMLKDTMLRLTWDSPEVKADIPEAGHMEPPVMVELDAPIDEREKSFNLKQILKNDSPLDYGVVSEVMREQGMRMVDDSIKHIRMRLQRERKVVVFAWHIDVIDALADGLSEFNPVTMTGKDSDTKKMKAQDTFNLDPGCRVFIGNLKSAGAGVPLHAANHSIFVETNWVPGDLRQAMRRTTHVTKTTPTTCDILTVRHSMSSRVLATILEKEIVIEKTIKETDLMAQKTNKDLMLETVERLVRIEDRLIMMCNRQGLTTQSDVDETNAVVAEHNAKATEEKAAEPSAVVEGAVAEPAEEKPKAKPKTGRPRKVKIEELRKIGQALINAEKRDGLKDLLGGFGYGSLKMVPEDKYEEIRDAMQKLLDGSDDSDDDLL